MPEKKKTTVKEVKKAPKKAPVVAEEEILDAEAGEAEVEEVVFEKTPETADFSGEYLKAVGRRKTSVAQVRLFKNGKGVIIINNKKASAYFPGEMLNILTQPLKASGHVRDLNFSIIVRGGGISGQVEAVRHGIARSLCLFDEALKDQMKVNGWLTRDRRSKERKKPGLKGARKRPQWSKR